MKGKLNIPVEEPFRLFFPASLFIGMIGVLLWPAFAWGIIQRYPAIAHARIMIEGFFFAFIMGFLGTAGPRMLSSPALRLWQVAAGFLLWLGLIGCHLTGIHVAGDILYLVLIAAMAAAAAGRCKQRRDIVPPGFVLVGMGVLSGIVGALCLIASSSGFGPFASAWWGERIGRNLLYQGFILLPIMGVAPFFFGRFGGLPNPHNFPTSRTPPSGWTRRAIKAATAGGLVWTGLILETWQPLFGGLLKTGAVAAYLLTEAPWRFRTEKTGTLGRVVQLGLAFLFVGSLFPGVLPGYRVGLLHFLFIGGFQLITFSVGSWVIFGHNGQRERGSQRLWPVRVAVALIVLALATRLSADVFPQVALSHYTYAAIAWALGVLIWGLVVFWRHLPRVE